MQTKTTDICIIGAGPSGIFASFEAGINGMKTLLIDSLDFPGGQCSALYPQKPIYDIPAFPAISAQNLIDNLVQQASRFNPEYLFNNKVIDIKTNTENVIIITDKNIIIQAKAVIIAAGCGFFGPNKPPLKNIEKYEDKSIFYLVNNKKIFKDKKIMIAGGGDSAIDWAIELSSIAKKVYVIHRRDKFRAMHDSIAKMQELVKQSMIELIIPYSLSEIEDDGNGSIKSITVEDIDGAKKSVDAQYLLAFFGLTTDFGPLKNSGLKFDGLQIAVNQSTMQTNLDRVFAIGDACTYQNKLKLILSGFSEAATAIHKIKEIVFPGKVFNFEYSTSSLSTK